MRSAVTLTGRLVDTPRFSKPGTRPSRPDVRTTFEIEGIHSGGRVELHATEETAERIVTTLKAGDVIIVTCWSEQREGASWRLFVDSFTVRAT